MKQIAKEMKWLPLELLLDLDLLFWIWNKNVFHSGIKHIMDLKKGLYEQQINKENWTRVKNAIGILSYGNELKGHFP